MSTTKTQTRRHLASARKPVMAVVSTPEARTTIDAKFKYMSNQERKSKLRDRAVVVGSVAVLATVMAVLAHNTDERPLPHTEDLPANEKVVDYLRPDEHNLGQMARRIEGRGHDVGPLVDELTRQAVQHDGDTVVVSDERFEVPANQYTNNK